MAKVVIALVGGGDQDAGASSLKSRGGLLLVAEQAQPLQSGNVAEQDGGQVGSVVGGEMLNAVSSRSLQFGVAKYQVFEL